MDTIGMKTVTKFNRPETLPQQSQWLASPTPEQLASTLAITIADQLRNALLVRPKASLAVSGGRTPKVMLQQLSQQQLDWHRVDITLVDERWVPEEDSASNAALVRAWLLKNHAAEATFYPIYTGQKSALEGQQHCQQRLNAMHWPLDVLVLGMGNDGHTASLFPLCPHLHNALSTDAICIATCAPVIPTDRMTLSATTLKLATHTHLHIEGDQKCQVLIHAINLKDPLQTPIYTFLQHPLAIHWCP
jgi:6-phosphogluconolactonase|tara:strand:- start:721 stop:1461 length:741 start_codon:yes stop_codon:yes gene_type:complete